MTNKPIQSFCPVLIQFLRISLKICLEVPQSDSTIFNGLHKKFLKNCWLTFYAMIFVQNTSFSIIRFVFQEKWELYLFCVNAIFKDHILFQQTQANTEYLLICLNKQGSDMPQVQNMPKFWTWQSPKYYRFSICELHSVQMNMPEYALREFWIYLVLNMPGFWIW